jgi:hypothetical protein
VRGVKFKEIFEVKGKLLLLQFLGHPQVFKVLLIVMDLVLIDSVDLMEIKFESIA